MTNDERVTPCKGWRERLDTAICVGLVSLLAASTLNGYSVEVELFEVDLTVRPDQVVLLFTAPLVGLGLWLGRLRLRLTRFDALIAVFLGSNVAASILTPSSRSTSLRGAALLLGYIAMYMVVRQVVANRPDWLPHATSWLIGLGIVQTCYSLLAFALYPYGYVVGGLQIGHLTETSVAIRGTFWESNLLGGYLAVIAVVMASRYAVGAGRESSSRNLVGVFLASLALPLTMTRAAGAALGLGLAAIVVFLLVGRNEIRNWTRRTAFLSATLACVVLLTATIMDDLASAAAGNPDFLVQRWRPESWRPNRPGSAATAQKGEAAPTSAHSSVSSRATDEGAVTRVSRHSVQGRLDVWQRGVEAWQRRPILGHGTLAGGDIVQDGWWYSSLVQALYDTGLVGFMALSGIYLAGILYPIRMWFRVPRRDSGASLLAFGVCNGVLLFTSQFSSFLFVGFPWVFLGVTIGTTEVYSTMHAVEAKK